MLDKPDLSDLIKRFLEKIGMSEDEAIRDKRKLVIASTKVILKSDYGMCAGIAAGNFLRDGEETINGIIQEMGGMCGEKAEALKTVLNYFDVDCRIAAAGEGKGALPKKKMREILKNCPGDPEGQKIYKYFRHAANIVVLNSRKYLVDPTLKEVPILSRYGPRRLYKINFFGCKKRYFYRELPEDIYKLILADMRTNTEVWAVFGTTFALLADYARTRLIKLVLCSNSEKKLSDLTKRYTEIGCKIVHAVPLKKVERLKNDNFQIEFGQFFRNWLNQDRIEEFQSACRRLNQMINQRKERLTKAIQVKNINLLVPLLVFVKKVIQ